MSTISLDDAANQSRVLEYLRLPEDSLPRLKSVIQAVFRIRS